MSKFEWIFVAALLSTIVSLGGSLAQDSPAGQSTKSGQDAAAASKRSETASHESISAAVRGLVLGSTPRHPIEAGLLVGSINLKGARLDDLILIERLSDGEIAKTVMLSPSLAPTGYFIDHGWAPAAGANLTLPDAETSWKVESSAKALTPETPLLLHYDNGEGLIFRRQIEIDESYLFRITQFVENTGKTPVGIFQYARIVRQGVPASHSSTVGTEGPILATGTQRPSMLSYRDVELLKQIDYPGVEGWIAYSEGYWVVAAASPPNEQVNSRLAYSITAGIPVYQAAYVETSPLVVRPGDNVGLVNYVYAGPKDKATIDKVETDLGIRSFGFLSY